MALSERERDALRAMFEQAYAPGTVTGGILKASRPNHSVEWNSELEARISDGHVESSVTQFLEANRILAKRRDDA